MIRKALFLLVTLGLIIVSTIAILAFIPTSVSDTKVSGLHLRPERWSGTITIVGDTAFAPWVNLTIEPGTKILFDKNPDIPNTNWTRFADAYIKDHNDPTGREGYNQSHFDLASRVIAIGTKQQPIIFTSAQPKPEYADWDQLIVFGGSVLDHVELSYAHNGIYIGNDTVLFDGGKGVTVTNSTVHDSLWSCIDIWSTNATITSNVIYHCWHQAIGVKRRGMNRIEENTIHDAQLGINCENQAKPTIINNHFEAAPLGSDCPSDEKNQDIGRIADTPGGTYNGKLIYPSNAQ